ncbi:MAG: hypothetical protein KZQ83_06195 [gamma proteobacterium symbiont of Taylorina sp.]|nr:hypothetical protein [gamma proteobacterium symbiont of Taylorina sp.]
MKRFLHLVLFLALFIPIESVLSADLSSNIMRRVNSANQSLDKAEDLIQRSMAGNSSNHIVGAQEQYDNIFKYYGTSFDHNHPTLITLKARIDELTAKSKGEVVAVKNTAPSKPAAATSRKLSSNIMRFVNSANASLDKAEEQIKSGSAEFAKSKINSAKSDFDLIGKRYADSYDPNDVMLTTLQVRIKQVSASMESALAAAQGNANKPSTSSGTANKLMSNITRQLRIGNSSLDAAKEDITKGNSPDYNIDKAQSSYEKIFSRYKGSFAPNHPEIVAFKARIEELKNAENAAIRQQMATQPPQSINRILGMSDKAGRKLKRVGSSLGLFETSLATAQKNHAGKTVAHINSAATATRNFKAVEKVFAEFNKEFSGKFKTSNESYTYVTNQIAKGKKALAVLKGELDSDADTLAKAASEKLGADKQAILTKYQNMPLSSNLHKNNTGKIVWSTQRITSSDQDKVKTGSTFNLMQPLYGRIFLLQSIGNTPVYSTVEKFKNIPKFNTNATFELKIFVDGKDQDKMFNGHNKIGKTEFESLTSWEMGLHSLPYDDFFKGDGKAWRGISKNMSVGSHKVRIELWATSGSYRSQGAISAGEFTLIKNKGDRIKATGKFPGDSNSGDTEAIRTDMVKALKNANSKPYRKLSVISDWNHGVHKGKNIQYRSISSAILFTDEDNDGDCRYLNYNFISDHLGGKNWTPLKYWGVCTDCLDGEIECDQ